MQELEVYSMVGTEGFTRLVAAFYRQVPQDDLLGPMYPATDLPGAERRLRDFLIGRFGGPQTYIEQRGHPRLRARHSPFHINQAVPEGSQGSRYAVEFILKSRAFFLELTDYRLHQCFGHGGNPITRDF
jgi:hypothetical protein